MANALRSSRPGRQKVNMMNATKKHNRIPSGIAIEFRTDGDSSCGASWYEAIATQTGEVLMVSDSVPAIPYVQSENSEKIVSLRAAFVRDVIAALNRG
jgi:hypothetical protein